MSDHLIAEANRHAMSLPTTNPTHADIAWYVREIIEIRAHADRVNDANDRLTAELAALREDKARLDYMDRGWDSRIEHAYSTQCCSIRDAIDAARKEAKP